MHTSRKKISPQKYINCKKMHGNAWKCIKMHKNALKMHKNAYCRIASFRVPRQSFCGKFKLSAESGRPRRPLLECMTLSSNYVQNSGLVVAGGVGWVIIASWKTLGLLSTHVQSGKPIQSLCYKSLKQISEEW